MEQFLRTLNMVDLTLEQIKPIADAHSICYITSPIEISPTTNNPHIHGYFKFENDKAYQAFRTQIRQKFKKTGNAFKFQKYNHTRDGFAYVLKEGREDIIHKGMSDEFINSVKEWIPKQDYKCKSKGTQIQKVIESFRVNELHKYIGVRLGDRQLFEIVSFISEEYTYENKGLEKRHVKAIYNSLLHIIHKASSGKFREGYYLEDCQNQMTPYERFVNDIINN